MKSKILIAAIFLMVTNAVEVLQRMPPQEIPREAMVNFKSPETMINSQSQNVFEQLKVELPKLSEKSVRRGDILKEYDSMNDNLLANYRNPTIEAKTGFQKSKVTIYSQLIAYRMEDEKEFKSFRAQVKSTFGDNSRIGKWADKVYNIQKRDLENLQVRTSNAFSEEDLSSVLKEIKAIKKSSVQTKLSNAIADAKSWTQKWYSKKENRVSTGAEQSKVMFGALMALALLSIPITFLTVILVAENIKNYQENNYRDLAAHQDDIIANVQKQYANGNTPAPNSDYLQLLS